MTRKFIIVLAITTLFTALVVGFSWIYLSQLLRQRLLRAAITNYLQTDANLNDMLESVVGNSRIIYDAAIIDPSGVAILDTNPALNGKPVPERPRLCVLRDAGFRRQLRLLYGPATVYDVSSGLELDGHEFGGVRVGVSTVFLRNELTPKLQQAA